MQDLTILGSCRPLLGRGPDEGLFYPLSGASAIASKDHILFPYRFRRLELGGVIAQEPDGFIVRPVGMAVAFGCGTCRRRFSTFVARRIDFHKPGPKGRLYP